MSGLIFVLMVFVFLSCQFFGFFVEEILFIKFEITGESTDKPCDLGGRFLCLA